MNAYIEHFIRWKSDNAETLLSGKILEYKNSIIIEYFKYRYRIIFDSVPFYVIDEKRVLSIM